MLCSIRDNEKVVDWIFSEAMQIQESEPLVVLKEVQANSELIWLGSGDSHNDKDWKPVTSGSCSTCRSAITE